MQIQPDQMVHAKGPGSMRGAEGIHVGTVDDVEGDYIKLKKSDSEDGMHHWIPVAWVDKVDDRAVYLSKTPEEFKSQQLNESPMNA